MGFVFSKLFGGLFGGKEKRMLILGLDNAGKTTILCKYYLSTVDKMKLDQVIQSVPTIGFNVETCKFKNLTFQVWDLGGQQGIRPYWRSYYPNTNALIYVIDSEDRSRLETTKQELFSMLEEEELKDVPLLLLANKQDMHNAMNELEISEYLGLAQLKNRHWSIFKCSALTGFGLKEGMEWMVNVISQPN